MAAIACLLAGQPAAARNLPITHQSVRGVQQKIRLSSSSGRSLMPTPPPQLPLPLPLSPHKGAALPPALPWPLLEGLLGPTAAAEALPGELLG